MNKRLLGSQAEYLVSKTLVSNGYRVCERNYYSHVGEIDLIAEKNEWLVFIEVKSRHDHDLMAAAESVTWKKQRKIIRTAQYYLLEHKLGSVACRFDVICVTNARAAHPDIHWIKNAFVNGC